MTRVNLAVPMCEYAHVSREKFLNKKLFMVRKAVQECIYLTQEVHKIKVQKLIMKTSKVGLSLSSCMFMSLHTVMWKTYLSSVGQKQCGGKVSSDTTENINDGDADPTSQLLQISQYSHLKHH